MSEYLHSDEDDFDTSQFTDIDIDSDGPPDLPTDSENDFSSQSTDPNMSIVPNDNQEEDLESSDWDSFHGSSDENEQDDFTNSDNESEEDVSEFSMDSDSSFEDTNDDFTNTDDDFVSEDEESDEEVPEFSMDSDNSFEEAEDDFASTDDDFEDQDEFENESIEDEFSDEDEFSLDGNSGDSTDDSTDETIEAEDDEFGIDLGTDESFENAEDQAVHTVSEEIIEDGPTVIEEVIEAIDSSVNTPIKEIVSEPVLTHSDKPKETFQELQKFAQNLSYSNMAVEGNPPFSIIIKDIKFEEDVRDILILLKEFGVVSPEDEENAKKSLSRGQFLIPRINEYSAILICHKLRRFNISILMGLSEEIYPSNTTEETDKGLVSKFSVYQNKKHHYELDDNSRSIDNIIATTLNKLDDFQILKYHGVATEYTIVDMENFDNDNSLLNDIYEKTYDNLKAMTLSNQMKDANKDSAGSLVPLDIVNAEQLDVLNKEKYNMNDVYNGLIEKLKLQALENYANGILGINYQVTPLIANEAHHTRSQYKITCTGNLVWMAQN